MKTASLAERPLLWSTYLSELALERLGAVSGILPKPRDFDSVLRHSSVGSAVRAATSRLHRGPVSRLAAFLQSESRRALFNPQESHTLGSEGEIWPMHLPARPFGECAAPGSRESRRKYYDKCTAWYFTVFQITMYNYWFLYCPKGLSQYKAKMGPYRMSSQQVDTALGLFKSNLRFCRCRPSLAIGPGRGQNTLYKLLSNMEADMGKEDFDLGRKLNELVNVSKEVEAEPKARPLARSEQKKSLEQ